MSNGRDERFLKYTLDTQLDDGKLAAYDSHYDVIRREMSRQGTLRVSPRFADVGCGRGLYAEYWQSRGCRVTGVDLNQRTLAIGRARATERDMPIHYVAGSADALPFKSGSFDIVFAMSLLEHVADWRQCARDLSRLLAPGGLLWIETTNIICPRQREFRWLPMYSWWPGPAKRVVERLARGPIPALANYTPWPAVHWLSYFKLRRLLQSEGLLVSDRFDCMKTEDISLPKSVVRGVARSGDLGRWVSYLLVSSVIVLATKPRFPGTRGAQS